jgi:hypothetical protein
MGIFIFVCTTVGLLPAGESPIAVSDDDDDADDDDDDIMILLVTECTNNRYFSFSLLTLS